MNSRFITTVLACLGIAIPVLIVSPITATNILETNSSAIRPLITTAELVKGTNRFAFGLLKDNQLFNNAKVSMRLYRLAGNQHVLAAETTAKFHAITAEKQKETIHIHADGTRHVHSNDTDVRGLYITRLDFASSGVWGLEMIIQGGTAAEETVRLSLKVLDKAPTPNVGSPAPRSHNLIADDVKDLREIDTSPTPDPRLHRVRIADAIAQGRPQLIAFATPQFCLTRMCGPVIDIVRGLLPEYEDRVVFTHQEIWKDFATKKLLPTVIEWRLSSEPWIFVVDGNGIIRAKFEGLVTEDELKGALKLVVRSTSDHGS